MPNATEKPTRCYALRRSEGQIRTACRQVVAYDSDEWTTAGNVVTCPKCRRRKEWRERASRMGQGGGDAPVPVQAVRAPSRMTPGARRIGRRKVTA